MLHLDLVRGAERDEIIAERAVTGLQARRVQVLVEELQTACRRLGLLELLAQKLLLQFVLSPLGVNLLPALLGRILEVLGLDDVDEVFDHVHAEEPVDRLVALLGLVEQERPDAALLEQHGPHERVHVDPEEPVALHLGLFVLEALLAVRDRELSGVPVYRQGLVAAREYHLTRIAFPLLPDRSEKALEQVVLQDSVRKAAIQNPLQRERHRGLADPVVAVKHA